MDVFGFQADVGELNIKTCWSCRRLPKGLSQFLSPEAKLAISQTKEHFPVCSALGSVNTAPVPDGNTPAGSLQAAEEPTVMTQKNTFGEAYQRLEALRLAGDITVPTPPEGDENRPSKRPICGGKLGNAMELVETVYSGQENCDAEVGDYAEQDRAKLISMEKCLVWFDVQRKNVDIGQTSQQNFSHVVINTV